MMCHRIWNAQWGRWNILYSSLPSCEVWHGSTVATVNTKISNDLLARGAACGLFFLGGSLGKERRPIIKQTKNARPDPRARHM